MRRRPTKEEKAKEHWSHRQQFKKSPMGVVHQHSPDKMPTYPDSSQVSFRNLRYIAKALKRKMERSHAAVG